MEKYELNLEKMIYDSNKRKKGYEPSLYDAAYEHGWNEALKTVKRMIIKSIEIDKNNQQKNTYIREGKEYEII